MKESGEESFVKKKEVVNPNRVENTEHLPKIKYIQLEGRVEDGLRGKKPIPISPYLGPLIVMILLREKKKIESGCFQYKNE